MDTGQPVKYTDFTKEEIELYLKNLKQAVQNDRYRISHGQNRQENETFIKDYNIGPQKQKEILLGLQFSDFCYAVQNQKEQYSYEKLYVFCKALELNNLDISELIDIYIKTNLVESKSKKDYVVVISFHKRNKSITYLFK